MDTPTLGLSLAILLTASSTLAVQFPDGTVSFEQAPRLVEAKTTFKGVGAWGAKYYFTIELPSDAGEPLQRVTLNLRQGADDIRFRIDDTFAFIGPPDGDRELLTQTATIDENDTISVVFEPPISPGTTVTVGLRPRRNPDLDGVYLFGVTAFPAGEKPYGLYLGPGRLQFYRGGNDELF